MQSMIIFIFAERRGGSPKRLGLDSSSSSPSPPLLLLLLLLLLFHYFSFSFLFFLFNALKVPNLRVSRLVNFLGHVDNGCRGLYQSRQRRSRSDAALVLPPPPLSPSFPPFLLSLFLLLFLSLIVLSLPAQVLHLCRCRCISEDRH